MTTTFLWNLKALYYQKWHQEHEKGPNYQIGHFAYIQWDTITVLYVTHLLPRAYFHTKDKMIPVKIVEVIGRRRRIVYRQTDGTIRSLCANWWGTVTNGIRDTSRPQGLYVHAKNEMIVVNIVEAIARTRIRLQADRRTNMLYAHIRLGSVTYIRLQTDKQTDRRTNGRIRWNQYTPTPTPNPPNNYAVEGGGGGGGHNYSSHHWCNMASLRHNELINEDTNLTYGVTRS